MNLLLLNADFINPNTVQRFLKNAAPQENRGK